MSSFGAGPHGGSGRIQNPFPKEVAALPSFRALERLINSAYPELHRRARAMTSSCRSTLPAAAVVHEAWIKLAESPLTPVLELGDEAHGRALIVRTMRQVLVDHARRERSQKRGGGVQIGELEDAEDVRWRGLEWVLAVREAMARLAEENERLARLVEHRFFEGLSEAETARALGVSLRTVERDWPRARSRLVELMRYDERGSQNEAEAKDGTSCAHPLA